jgi:hypothetical protein
MKAITVWQPWASLIACGAKTFETRSWAPPLSVIGRRIAIHAAKADTLKIFEALPRDIVLAIGDALEDAGLDGADWGTLPRGAVVCTAQLSAAHLCGNMNPDSMVYVEKTVGSIDAPILIEADPFGDFSHGRWAWQLDDVQPLEKPAMALGHQGFWNWEQPRNLLPTLAGQKTLGLSSGDFHEP